MEFKKHLAKGIVFLTGLLFLLYLLSHIFYPDNMAEENEIEGIAFRGLFKEPENSIDVLILGDSECYTSIIPLKLWEKYGITSFCCGTPAQNIHYSEELLHKAFKKQTPKVVLLETNTIFRRLPLNNYIEYKARETFPILEYHNRWKFFLPLEYDSQAEEFANDKGYRFSLKVSEAENKNYMKPTKRRASISNKNIKYLKRIKSFCEENGAKLILISVPSAINWNTPRHNSMEKLAKELGVEFIDLNTKKKAVKINWATDTRDKGDHLNHYGAKKVTNYLGKYLSKKQNVPNHKNNPDYIKWDEQLEKFNKKVTEAEEAEQT